MKKDSDDAVSVVVALMLILAIVSICIAAYTTTYVPGLKQQDEITKSDDIRYAFERFSSDVDNIMSLGRAASFSETFPLGGGDVALSPSKSSGTVELKEENIGSVTVDRTTYQINSVNVSYTPSYSSWEPQGYLYRKGVVWITKGDKMTPSSQNLYTVEMGLNEEKKTVLGWLSKNMDNNVLTVYTMEIDKTAKSITGSGFAKLRLEATINDTIYQATLDQSDYLSINIQNNINNKNNQFEILRNSQITIRIITIKVSVE